MTVIHHTTHTLPGCTCQHAPALHQAAAPTGQHPDTNGCRVGWSGAGEPVPGTPHIRHWPAGCTCPAVPQGQPGEVILYA